MKKLFALAVLSCSLTIAGAQRVAAYLDYKNYFVVFDDGSFKEIEYTPVSDFKVGGDFVAYLNMDNSLKFYYKGDTYTLEEAQPQSYACSENFCVYKMNRRLEKVEAGNKRTLCEWATDYAVGDSIVAFVDYGDPGFKVYYNGEIATVETGATNGGVKQYQVSQNLVAYVDYNNELKVWWHGKTYELDSKGFNLDYRIGTDIVAFSNSYTNEFKVFYKGEIIVLDQTPPLKFQVDFNSVAYVDAGSNFNIFYNGETMFVSPFAPDTMTAAGNIVSFVLKNEFKVFFKGKIYTLEKQRVNSPGTIAISRNTLSYVDNVNHLKMFDNGEIRPNVSYELPLKLRNMNDIIVYYPALTTVSIFYKGKVY